MEADGKPFLGNCFFGVGAGHWTLYSLEFGEAKLGDRKKALVFELLITVCSLPLCYPGLTQT